MSAPRLAFQQAYDVSREAMARFDRYVDLLHRWNPRINLVSAATLADVWDRHIADSAQLLDLAPPDARLWLDVGSGAGFPGLVIAALSPERRPGLTVRVVESDQRKAAFLATVIREAALPATVVAQRWDSLPPSAADVVSARALAPLADLLGIVEKHARPGGIGLFPKGEAVHKEIAEAAVRWRFEHRLTPSRTQPKAAIVEIGAVERV